MGGWGWGGQGAQGQELCQQGLCAGARCVRRAAGRAGRTQQEVAMVLVDLANASHRCTKTRPSVLQGINLGPAMLASESQPQVDLLTTAFTAGKLRIASPTAVTLQDSNPEVSSQSSSLFHVAATPIWELLFFCHSACIVSCKHSFNY